MLYDAAMILQHTDFIHEESVRSCFDKLEKVVAVFDGHAITEDEMVFPVIQNIAPDIVEDFESQHVTDHRLSHELLNLMLTYDYAKTVASKLQCGIKVQIAFQEFIAFNLQHMNKEETVINEILWNSFADEAIMGIEQQIVAKQDPSKAEFVMRWMLKGINDMELIFWLEKVKKFAPPVVLEGLYTLAEQELSTERWSMIREQVEEQPFILY
jgi:hypothetical protein